MKKILLFIFILMLTCTSAFAATLDEYKLSYLQEPPMDKLMEITFGDEAGKAKNSEFRTGRDYYLIDDFYQIPNDKNNRFLAWHVVKKYPCQSSLYSHIDNADKNWWSNGGENTEPSGEAKGGLSRKEALKEAEDIMLNLGFNNFSFINAIAYGATTIPDKPNLPKVIHYYEVVYRQNINGMPIYLSSPYFEEDDQGAVEWNMNSLEIKLTICEEKIGNIDIKVSEIIPQNNAMEDIGEAKALEIFKAKGINADKLELCYLVQPINKEAIATPAYRYLNNYLSATTGNWLQ